MAKKGAAAEPKAGDDEGTREDTKASKALALVETKPDQALVEAATDFIREAIRKTLERGFLEIGEYLFRTFFANDPARLHSKSMNKAASFRALLERCDTLELPLRKSALHNAVSIAAMQHLLGAGPVAYKQLPVSHQVALLPMRDPKKVERLASRALSKKLTVRVLKEEVAAERAAATEGEKRGRKPDPVLLKALKAATAAFTVDGRLRQVTKAQVEELSEEQRAAVLEMAERLKGVCEGVVGKLE